MPFIFTRFIIRFTLGQLAGHDFTGNVFRICDESRSNISLLFETIILKDLQSNEITTFCKSKQRL